MNTRLNLVFLPQIDLMRDLCRRILHPDPLFFIRFPIGCIVSPLWRYSDSWMNYVANGQRKHYYLA